MAHIKPTKYGMDMVKKTLDTLMGVNRNGDRPDAIIQSYRDRRVCKYSLVGLCPHTLFSNTKMYLGACKADCCPAPKNLRKQFLADLEEGDSLCWKFVRDAERFYTDLVSKCDEKKKTNQWRLDEQNKEAGHVAPLENEELKLTIDKMEELSTQVEKLGEEGNIEEAQKRMKELEELTKRKEHLESIIKPKSNQQELLVCDVCAAILSVNETDQRLADHFAGKAHIGYSKLREKSKELIQKLKEHDAKTGGVHHQDNRYHRHHSREPPGSYHHRGGGGGYRGGAGGYRGGRPYYPPRDNRFDGGRPRSRSPFGGSRKRYRESSYDRGGGGRGMSPAAKRRRM